MAVKREVRRRAEQQLRLRRAQRHARRQALRGVTHDRRRVQLDRALIRDPALASDRRQGRSGRAALGRRTASRSSRRPTSSASARWPTRSIARSTATSSRSPPTSTSTRPTSASCGRPASSAGTRGCRRKMARIATRWSRCCAEAEPARRRTDARVPHRRWPRHAGGARVLHEMFRALKARASRTCTSRRSPRSRSRTSRASRRCRGATCSIALREAGLDTMPGGGAEMFSAACARQIADKKLGGEDYIDVHRAAHALGIRSNCTMLYGHVETIEDRMAAPGDAARPAGRDRRLPRLHPARVSPRRQRAGRDGSASHGHARRPASTT